MSTVENPVPEEVESVLLEADERVGVAVDAMRRIVAESDQKTWTPRELQQQTQDATGLSGSIVSIAFWRLVGSRELRVDDELTAHADAGDE